MKKKLIISLLVAVTCSSCGKGEDQEVYLSPTTDQVIDEIYEDVEIEEVIEQREPVVTSPTLTEIQEAMYRITENQLYVNDVNLETATLKVGSYALKMNGSNYNVITQGSLEQLIPSGFIVEEVVEENTEEVVEDIYTVITLAENVNAYVHETITGDTSVVVIGVNEYGTYNYVQLVDTVNLLYYAEQAEAIAKKEKRDTTVELEYKLLLDDLLETVKSVFDHTKDLPRVGSAGVINVEDSIYLHRDLTGLEKSYMSVSSSGVSYVQSRTGIEIMVVSRWSDFTNYYTKENFNSQVELSNAEPLYYTDTMASDGVAVQRTYKYKDVYISVKADSVEHLVYALDGIVFR